MSEWRGRRRISGGLVVTANAFLAGVGAGVNAIVSLVMANFDAVGGWETSIGWKKAYEVPVSPRKGAIVSVKVFP